MPPAMKNILSKFVVSCICIVCVSCIHGDKVRFVNYSASRNQTIEKQSFTLKIPKGYKRLAISDGCGDGKVYSYCYNDSSILYMTNTMSPNYDNIEGQGLLSKLANYKFNRHDLTDTLDMSGIDSSGACWRELRIGEVSIGYMNVPYAKKPQFDGILSMVKVK